MYEDMEWEKKYHLLKRIGLIYQNCKTQIKLNGSFFVEENSAFYKYLEVKENVDAALKKLNPKEVQIVENEYLKNTRNNWYLAYYNEEEFRKVNTQVANKFLHCLYGECLL